MTSDGTDLVSNGETEPLVITVVGATGAVGSSVAQLLGSAGHSVRPVAKSHGVALDDEDALTRAFSGADAAFLTVPFDRGSDDLHAFEREVVARLVDAVSRSGVQRVVVLSGTSAALGVEGAGSGSGAALLEEAVKQLDLRATVILRAAYHMENLLAGFDEIDKDGTFHGPFVADRATPMIAAADVGPAAAAHLTADEIGEPVVHELLGPRDYTMAEAAAAIGTALGRPARYVQVDDETARAAMTAGGVSASFAEAVMETARSFNAGRQWEREVRTAENTTPTTLEEFCASVARSRADRRDGE